MGNPARRLVDILDQWSIRGRDLTTRALRWYSTREQGGDLDPVAKPEVDRLVEFS